MTNEQHKWITDMAAMAKAAGHVWPEMAACEAALESNYGKSQLAREAHNLFGQKQHRNPDNETLVLPTREYECGEWVTCSAEWEKFDTEAESFAARMDTLKRLAPKYEHYKHALQALDPVTFVLEVSRTWATDPERGNKCLAIYVDWYKGGVDVNPEG